MELDSTTNEAELLDGDEGYYELEDAMVVYSFRDRLRALFTWPEQFELGRMRVLVVMLLAMVASVSASWLRGYETRAAWAELGAARENYAAVVSQLRNVKGGGDLVNRDNVVRFGELSKNHDLTSSWLEARERCDAAAKRVYAVIGSSSGADVPTCGMKTM